MSASPFLRMPHPSLTCRSPQNGYFFQNKFQHSYTFWKYWFKITLWLLYEGGVFFFKRVPPLLCPHSNSCIWDRTRALPRFLFTAAVCTGRPALSAASPETPTAPGMEHRALATCQTPRGLYLKHPTLLFRASKTIKLMNWEIYSTSKMCCVNVMNSCQRPFADGSVARM